MPSARRLKRGTATKRLHLLERIRPLLRAEEPPERKLRAVATVLAVDVGEYCIVDMLERSGVIRRVTIEHPDPSRAVKLGVAVASSMDASTNLRVTRLLARAESEIVPRVTEAYRARGLADLTLLKGDVVRSYMAASVVASGSAVAVLTVVSTHPVRRYTEDELRFLESVAEWTGLGVESSRRDMDVDVPPQRMPEEATTGVKRRSSATFARVRASRG